MTRRQPPQLYLLDTNVVSNLRRPRPDPDVLDWIGRQPPRSLAIAFSTVFEVQYGAELARRESPGKASDLETWLEGFVLSGRFRVLKPCAASVRIRAKMHATPALRGFLEGRPGAHKPPNGEKLVIAAQAIAVGAVVVTLNDRDFSRIDEHFHLPGVFNPCSGSWAVTAGDSTPGIQRTRRPVGRGGTTSRPVAHDFPANRWDQGTATRKAWAAAVSGRAMARDGASTDVRTASAKSVRRGETVP